MVQSPSILSRLMYTSRHRCSPGLSIWVAITLAIATQKETPGAPASRVFLVVLTVRRPVPLACCSWPGYIRSGSLFKENAAAYTGL